MDSKLLLIFLVAIPYIQSKLTTLHGYPVYDPIKYECKVVDGGWSEWSCFSHCSVSCGKGIQKRYRHCIAPVAKYGGKDCVGDKVEAKECDTKLKCPVEGGWSDYVKGSCSKTCGGGKVVFTRTCNNPTPMHCGKDCAGDPTRVEDCNTHACPTWSQWSCTNCTKQNDNKCEQKCTRTCIYHKNDKKYCDGNDTEYRTCDHSICYPDNPVDYYCNLCRNDAIRTSYLPGYPKTFVGFACRVPGLADFCKTADLSKNGGHPANFWFWIHCSPDGPWCKPCATRGLVFNKKCDACEYTRSGPCT